MLSNNRNRNASWKLCSWILSSSIFSTFVQEHLISELERRSSSGHFHIIISTLGGALKTTLNTVIIGFSASFFFYFSIFFILLFFSHLPVYFESYLDSPFPSPPLSRHRPTTKQAEIIRSCTNCKVRSYIKNVVNGVLLIVKWNFTEKTWTVFFFS